MKRNTIFWIIMILLFYSCGGESSKNQIDEIVNPSCPYQPIVNYEQNIATKDGTVNHASIDLIINRNLKKINIGVNLKDSLAIYNSLINDSLKSWATYSMEDISLHNRLIEILCSKWSNSRDTALPKEYRNKQLDILDSLELAYFTHIINMRKKTDSINTEIIKSPAKTEVKKKKNAIKKYSLTINCKFLSRNITSDNNIAVKSHKTIDNKLEEYQLMVDSGKHTFEFKINDKSYKSPEYDIKENSILTITNITEPSTFTSKSSKLTQ